MRIFTMREHVHHDMCEVVFMLLACLKCHERLCISKVIFCRVYPHRHKYILNGDAGVAAG